jgi:hypothetical protein
LINKANLLKAEGAQPKYIGENIRESTHQDPEQGKRAQKFAKLDNH